MTGTPRSLIRRRTRAAAAPLNSSLLLVVGRRKPSGSCQVRASASFGRRRISIFEMAREKVDLAIPTTGLAQLLDDLDPRLNQTARSELLDFVLSTVLPDLEKPGAYALGTSLHLLRERLRKPLPPMTYEGAERAMVDLIVAIDERSFWVVGWCTNEADMLLRLELISPEGQCAGSLEGAYRFARPDVEKSLTESGIHATHKHGYMKYVELPAPSPLEEGWIGELQSLSGKRVQIGAPPVDRDPAAARERILAQAMAEGPDVEQLRRDHAYPALTRLQARVRSSIGFESVVQHGEPPSSPEVSIVVPLYARTDLLEHQIAQFWKDPDIAAAELIYVLDSPELGESAALLASHLHSLYRLPFKLLRLNRHAGCAAVNNLAVSQARGRLLLFLDSDVLPTAPRWLGKMRSFYEATPEIGALGAKLLFEDESIQHAGVYFRRNVATGWWENQHYFKGFSRSLAPANVTRPVPSVTGACLMVERTLYEQLGGFQEIYIQGGYEDSDFCLRLIEAGRQNWYLPKVELYHLEAQSFPIHERLSNRYNTWLQTHLWDDRIRELMQSRRETTEAELVAG